LPCIRADQHLQAAGINKWDPRGKLDFHASRTAYVTFVIEAGANAKEAQILARHSTPDLTMNVYGRARWEGLSDTVEAVGEMVRGSTEGKEEASPSPESSPARGEEVGAENGYSMGLMAVGAEDLVRMDEPEMPQNALRQASE